MKPELAIPLLIVGVIALRMVFDLPQIAKTNKSKEPIVFTAPFGLAQTHQLIASWIGATDKKGRPKRHALDVTPQMITYGVTGVGVRLQLAQVSATSTRVSATPIPRSTEQAKFLVFIPVGPKRIAFIESYFKSVRELQTVVSTARVS